MQTNYASGLINIGIRDKRNKMISSVRKPQFLLKLDNDPTIKSIRLHYVLKSRPVGIERDEFILKNNRFNENTNFYEMKGDLLDKMTNLKVNDNNSKTVETLHCFSNSNGFQN